jgi:hypothetical protein
MRSSNIRVALLVVVIGCSLIRHHLRNERLHGNANTVPYQGQEFKMRKVYPTYEDYKDDRNNLDTNELDRIEQSIVSAKVPESFANQQELFHFLLGNLKFPGYGMGGIGDHAKADDGTSLLVETVEIPQRQKDRVLTFSQSGEQLKLVDDFVSSTATNRLRHLELKSKVLHYYDGENQEIRQKAL